MIEVSELRKTYRRSQALSGFSLKVEKGEAVGLVGPNGAGKTTLIKILATLLPADSGSARIAEWDVAEKPEAVRAVVGYLPDVAGIYQDLSIAEFLEFFADAYHLKDPLRDAAVERALEIAGLSEQRDEYVEHLSLGWKQRLQLAKTLIHEPKVLLLDEPASGLDPLARVAFREQLKRLRAAGITILVSSHILADLEDVCTRIVFISAGRNVTEAGLQEKLAVESRAVQCVIEFRGNAVAGDLTKKTAGITVLEISSTHLRLEVADGESAASGLLRSLLEAGVIVQRFDTKGIRLEERYVRAFRRPGQGSGK
jgi:ABC-2 type transport system ATP-binding protein